MGTLTSQAEIGVWFQAQLGALLWDQGEYDILYAKSCNIVHFGRKMIRNAVHNAFLNTLTVRTSFTCVLAVFQQWKRRSYRNDPWGTCRAQSAGKFYFLSCPSTFFGSTSTIGHFGQFIVCWSSTHGAPVPYGVDATGIVCIFCVNVTSEFRLRSEFIWVLMS